MAGQGDPNESPHPLVNKTLQVACTHACMRISCINALLSASGSRSILGVFADEASNTLWACSNDLSARFALLVDQQWLWKENRALTRRLQTARLKERGVLEDIDYQHPRGLDRKLVRTLATSEWVTQHQNILLLGPTGIGKSWLACALAQKACRDGFSVLHKRTSELCRELAVAHRRTVP